MVLALAGMLVVLTVTVGHLGRVAVSTPSFSELPSKLGFPTERSCTERSTLGVMAMGAGGANVSAVAGTLLAALVAVATTAVATTAFFLV